MQEKLLFFVKLVCITYAISMYNIIRGLLAWAYETKKRLPEQSFLYRNNIPSYGSITTSNILPDSTNFFKVACTVSTVIFSTAAL